MISGPTDPDERAVFIGFWTVSLPAQAILILFLLVPILVQGAERAFNPLEGLRITAALMLAGFVSGWLWWSFAAPRWRVWAYRRGTDLPRLKALAVADKLIWPDSHVFTRTEIRPRWLAAELAELEQAHAANRAAGPNAS